MGYKTHTQMATTPTIYNKTLTLANTEYNVELPLGTVYAEIQARTAHDVRVAWVTGKVAASTAPYWTLKSGEFVLLKNVKLIDNRTIYLASTDAATVVEITAWSI